MKVQARKVDVKRNTLGYKISGKWHTRNQAVKLASKGKLDGIVACQGPYGRYIQSTPSTELRLYDLPIVVDA